jgi:hypothetical protein
MKTIRLLLLIISISCSFNLIAQDGELEVSPIKFEEGDLTANENPRLDVASGTGNAAILKIITNIQGLTFEPDGLGFVGDPVFKTGVIWLYLPKGAKKFDIYSDKGSKRGILYGRPIESGMVYSMTVALPKGYVNKIERKNQNVTFHSVPEGALIILDDDTTERFGPTPFEKVLPLGTHTYRFELDDYQNSAGKFELKKDKELTIKDTLKPNFGFIYIESAPEPGASVVINKSALKDKTTPALSDALKPGFHTVFVSMKDGMYKTTSKKVEVKAGDTSKIKVEMPVNFATVNITTKPSAAIYIDNKLKGNNTWNGRVVIGEKIFEARIGSGEKYVKAQKTQVLEAGLTYNFELTPAPRTGILEVKTEPSNAKIIINGSDVDESGKPYGNTPMMGLSGIKLFLGKNTITFEKEGYSLTPKEIDIAENEITEIEEKLVKGTGITIESTPTGAKVTIDGKLIGKTPLTAGLDFGSHSIVLEKEDYSKTTTTFNVDTKQNKFSFTLYPSSTKINITSDVPSQVFIDDAFVGASPIKDHKILFGTHKIKLQATGFADKSDNLIVNPEGTTDFNFTFETNRAARRQAEPKAAETKPDESAETRTGYALWRQETKEYFRSYTPSLMYGLYRNNFLNTEFQNKINDGSIEYKYGQAFCMRFWSKYPFFWDMSWFSTQYNVKSWESTIGDSSVFHRGLEISLGSSLFNITKHFIMYGGVGYQFSQLAYGQTAWTWLTDPKSVDSGDNGIISSIKTSSPVWKIGTSLNFGHFQVFSEVKQSIGNEKYKNRQFFLGAAVTF